MISVFDIDGVLADASHRQHFLQSRPKDWQAFFSAVGADAPIERGIALARQAQSTGAVVLVSGRPESTRSETAAWMARHGVEHDRLVLRADGDFRSAAVAKAELVSAVATPEEVADLWDDDETVVAALGALGYPARLFR